MPIGIYLRTKEHGKNIGKANKGKKRTEEIKRKISKTKKGIKFTKQHKQNIRKSKLSEKNPFWKGGGRRYWQRLSREAWEKYHGRKIPKGGLIHHKDENWKNIDPTNLEMIVAKSGKLNDSRGRHFKWHAQLRKLKKRTEKFLKSLNLNPTQ